jgi:hypothetical protein
MKFFNVGAHDLCALERAGQEPAQKSDRIQVRLYVALEGRQQASEDFKRVSTHLCDEIMFGNRVLIMNSPLTWYWGEYSGLFENKRVKTCVFSADTFALAEAEAESFARVELEKLYKALDIRAEALRQAEDEADEKEDEDDVEK